MNIGRIKSIVDEAIEEKMHEYMKEHGWQWYKYFKSLDKKDVEKCDVCGKPIALTGGGCPASGCDPCAVPNPPAYCGD